MHSIQNLIETALAEDIGPGDITTDNTVPAEKCGYGDIVAKEPLILAGIDIAKRVFSYLDADIRFPVAGKDGDAVAPGEKVLGIEGNLRVLLKGERTALNFLQHLSGIATQTRSFVDELGDSAVRLVDTRKTTPGLRVLEKYAVRVGGAGNHRMALYDGVLIKDNHIAACGGIKTAIENVRKHISHLIKIEVEIAHLSQIQEALDAKADVIMLDNMTIDQIREAVEMIQKKALVEVSGSVRKENLKHLAQSGADIISVGALTHSARSMDLSMRIN